MLFFVFALFYRPPVVPSSYRPLTHPNLSTRAPPGAQDSGKLMVKYSHRRSVNRSTSRFILSKSAIGIYTEAKRM